MYVNECFVKEILEIFDEEVQNKKISKQEKTPLLINS